MPGELANRLTHSGCKGVWLRDSCPLEKEESDEDLASLFFLTFQAGGSLMASVRDLKVAFTISVARISLSCDCI